MILAFLIDQIQEFFIKDFQKALVVCKTKKYLFQKIREIFNTVSCDSMQTIYKIINKELKLTIQIIR